MPFFLNFLAGTTNIGTATTNRTSTPKAKNKLRALISDFYYNANK